MSEVGRRLTISELRVGTVVCVLPPCEHAVILTLWVKHVGETTIVFFAGEMNPPLNIINFILPNGLIVDDKGREVQVFEFLGPYEKIEPPLMN